MRAVVANPDPTLRMLRAQQDQTGRWVLADKPLPIVAWDVRTKNRLYEARPISPLMEPDFLADGKRIGVLYPDGTLIADNAEPAGWFFEGIAEWLDCLNAMEAEQVKRNAEIAAYHAEESEAMELAQQIVADRHRSAQAKPKRAKNATTERAAP